MVAAAPRAAAIAPNLRMKSIMATPFFHPPSRGAATKGAFALATCLGSGEISMVVDIFGLETENLIDINYSNNNIRDCMNWEYNLSCCENGFVVEAYIESI